MLRCSQATKDFFSNGRSDLICWMEVLKAQFNLTDLEALAVIVCCWPDGYPALETVWVNRPPKNF